VDPGRPRRGVVIRPDGRYREIAAGGFVLAWIVVFVVFQVWVEMHTGPADCTRAVPCGTPAQGFGSAILAAPAAVVVTAAAFAGRFGRRRVGRAPRREVHG
jgi:hypothetical protein